MHPLVPWFAGGAHICIRSDGAIKVGLVCFFTVQPANAAFCQGSVRQGYDSSCVCVRLSEVQHEHAFASSIVSFSCCLFGPRSLESLCPARNRHSSIFFLTLVLVDMRVRTRTAVSKERCIVLQRPRLSLIFALKLVGLSCYHITQHTALAELTANVVWTSPRLHPVSRFQGDPAAKLSLKMSSTLE